MSAAVLRVSARGPGESSGLGKYKPGTNGESFGISCRNGACTQDASVGLGKYKPGTVYKLSGIFKERTGRVMAERKSALIA